MKTTILSPFQVAVDESRNWTVDWYSWLKDFQERTDPAPTKVSKLTPPAAAGAGTRAFVTDSTVTLSGATAGSVVVGGGANTVPIWTDGVSWKIG